MSTLVVSVRVIAGSTSLGIAKSMRPAALTLTEVPGVGVRADGLGYLVWCTGNRKALPVLAKGDTLHLNSGDPTRRVTVEVA